MFGKWTTVLVTKWFEGSVEVDNVGCKDTIKMNLKAELLVTGTLGKQTIEVAPWIRLRIGGEYVDRSMHNITIAVSTMPFPELCIHSLGSWLYQKT